MGKKWRTIRARQEATAETVAGMNGVCKKPGGNAYAERNHQGEVSLSVEAGKMTADLLQKALMNLGRSRPQ